MNKTSVIVQNRNNDSIILKFNSNENIYEPFYIDPKIEINEDLKEIFSSKQEIDVSQFNFLTINEHELIILGFISEDYFLTNLKTKQITLDDLAINNLQRNQRSIYKHEFFMPTLKVGYIFDNQIAIEYAIHEIKFILDKDFPLSQQQKRLLINFPKNNTKDYNFLNLIVTDDASKFQQLFDPNWRTKSAKSILSDHSYQNLEYQELKYIAQVFKMEILDCDKILDDNQTFIHRIIIKNDIGLFRVLLNENVIQLDFKDTSDSTQLHWTCKYSLKMAKLLLLYLDFTPDQELKEILDHQDVKGRTPLHLLCYQMINAREDNDVQSIQELDQLIGMFLMYEADSNTIHDRNNKTCQMLIDQSKL